MELLNVGDVVFDCNRWSWLDRMVIERVTAKRAFSKHSQFEREIKITDHFSK